MNKKKLYERLKELRLSFWFSQENIANYLNINRAAVALMEKGERQIKINEIEKLAELYDMTIDTLKNWIQIKDVENSELDQDKFEKILLYILSSCWAKPNVWKTLIYKLLYFVDFWYYKNFWKSLTWLKYIKFPRWPVPYDFDVLINFMKEKALLTPIVTQYYWKLQYKLIPNKTVEDDELSETEREHIDNIIDKYSNCSASEISEISHNEMAWKITNDMCEIKYEFAKLWTNSN